MVWRRAAKAAARYAWRNRRRIIRGVRRAVKARSRRMRTVGRGRGRVYVPRVYGRPRSRVYRKLSRRINRIRNVLDIDTTFNDQTPLTYEYPNISGTPPGSTVAVPSLLSQSYSYVPLFKTLLQAGNRYRLKSLNERYSLSMGPVNSSDASVRGVRHIRIMYFLMRDEELPNTGSGSSATPDFSQIFSADSYSIRGPLQQNQGITYRVLYDKTFSVSSNSTKEFMVRLPARLFYDYGQVKFSPITGNQMNNYLYRIVFVDSLPIGAYSNSSDGSLRMLTHIRMKYYDFGGKQVGELASQVKALEDRVNVQREQIRTLQQTLGSHILSAESKFGDVDVELSTLDSNLVALKKLTDTALYPDTYWDDWIGSPLKIVKANYIPSSTSATVKSEVYTPLNPAHGIQVRTVLRDLYSMCWSIDQYGKRHGTEQHRGEQPSFSYTT